MDPENMNALFYGVIGFLTCWLLFRWLFGNHKGEHCKTDKSEVADVRNSVAILTVHVANLGCETGDAITSLVAAEKELDKRMTVLEKR